MFTFRPAPYNLQGDEGAVPTILTFLDSYRSRIVFTDVPTLKGA